MKRNRQRIIASAAACLLLRAAAASAADTPQGAAGNGRPPAPLEAALIGLECETGQSFDATGVDAHNDCLNSRLAALRADFGYNLDRLSAAERKELSTTCPSGRPEQRDGYLRCVGAGLQAMRDRRAAASLATPDATTSPLDSQDQAAPVPPAPRHMRLLLGGAIGLLVIGAGAAVSLRRPKRSSHPCRDCGAAFDEPGDLCLACRHKAAEARKQASVDRTLKQRTLAEERQRQREQEERDREERSRREEEEQCRQAIAAQQAEEARRQEAERRRLEETAASAAPPEEAFDPLQILGVSSEATQDEIREAYEAARAKYDESAVAHFGDEVRRHFRAKAEVVEAAYRSLAGVDLA